jgi:hypothetical protein
MWHPCASTPQLCPTLSVCPELCQPRDHQEPFLAWCRCEPAADEMGKKVEVPHAAEAPQICRAPSLGELWISVPGESAVTGEAAAAGEA